MHDNGAFFSNRHRFKLPSGLCSVKRVNATSRHVLKYLTIEFLAKKLQLRFEYFSGTY